MRTIFFSFVLILAASLATGTGIAFICPAYEPASCSGVAYGGVEFATGDPELDDYLNAPGVEREVIEVIHYQLHEAGELIEVSIAITHLLDEGDLENEPGFVLRDDGLALVKYQGQWVTEESFHRELRQEFLHRNGC